jgi:hypothetical protein
MKNKNEESHESVIEEDNDEEKEFKEPTESNNKIVNEQEGNYILF